MTAQEFLSGMDIIRALPEQSERRLQMKDLLDRMLLSQGFTLGTIQHEQDFLNQILDELEEPEPYGTSTDLRQTEPGPVGSGQANNQG